MRPTCSVSCMQTKLLRETYERGDVSKFSPLKYKGK